ncbi:MAG TPA: quinolinate synthase NadA [Actinomycetota bacterium]|nr:quinolinate synthase NadA [Actinomycetota bacterium]
MSQLTLLSPEAQRSGIDQAWADEVRRIAREQDAVILAHNYQVPAIQDVADHVGDSLELSRIAAEVDQSTIVFCGVHFMAESAKILAPEKRVLIPDKDAGCSLAASITADQLRAWKAEHPGSVVVMYVNTSAEVKAETDYCCTSANAVKVVESIPADRKILFGPDMFLGAHVERMTGRKLEVWMGECHVHAGIEPSDIQDTMAEHPDAELLIHPECGCSSQCMYLLSTGDLPADRTFVLGTGGMVRRMRESNAKEFIIATETGMLHRLRQENSRAEMIAANPGAVCGYMKMITPSKLLRCLETGTDEVDVPEEIASRARLAIERMIAIG